MSANDSVLLDSSVVVQYFRGDAGIRRHMQGCSVLYLSATALGELYCGAHLSGHRNKVVAEIRNLLGAVVVLPVGAATAEQYGRLRAALARAGTPIPENDIWIAAAAVEYELPVAARDEHFQRVSGLQVVAW